ncbi:phytoene dehydrogenase, partial [Streptomyces sp. NPDC127044]
PGVGRRRPGAGPCARGCLRPGRCTATGGPATWERADGWGAGAARAALGALGRPRDHLLAFEEAA